MHAGAGFIDEYTGKGSVVVAYWPIRYTTVHYAKLRSVKRTRIRLPTNLWIQRSDREMEQVNNSMNGDAIGHHAGASHFQALQGIQVGLALQG